MQISILIHLEASNIIGVGGGETNIWDSNHEGEKVHLYKKEENYKCNNYLLV